MRSSTETLIDALRILGHDIHSGDGVANACIAEAAERLEELAARRFPEGWRLVPIKPTQHMLDEAWASALAENATSVWQDMIEAAPLYVGIEDEET